MKFGILSSPVPGHMIPLSSLSAELIRRGHEVLFFSIRDTEEFLKDRGMTPLRYGEKWFPEGSWEKRWGPLRSLHGIKATLKTSFIHKDIAKAMCNDIPSLITEHSIEHLIIDQVQFQGRAIAERCALPFTTVCCAFPMNSSGELPPPTQSGTPATSLLDKLRNRFHHTLFRTVIKRTNIAEAQKLLRRHGMKSYKTPEESYSKTLQIIPSIAACDFAQPWQHNTQICYTGAFLEQSYSIQKSKKPLIYISLGTLQNDNESLFQKIIAGVLQCDVEIIVGMGDWSSPGTYNFVDSVTVLPMAPQKEILARASLAISHGGFNTFNESLALNTPLLIIPITNDQPGVASRVKALGLGRTIALKDVTPGKVRDTVKQLFMDREIQEKVQEISDEQIASGGISAAADALLRSVAEI